MPALLNQQELPRLFTESLYQDPKKPHLHRLLRPVEVTLSNSEFIHIPKNFITDFATVPRLCWGIIPPAGRHNLATVIHDYLYVNKYSVTAGLDPEQDRLFADQEMLYWLRKSHNSEIKAQVMYKAVRLGGKKWWNKP
ncbi:MAG: DUF1353 domain-containing protein [Adhaeribacter sp.]